MIQDYIDSLSGVTRDRLMQLCAIVQPYLSGKSTARFSNNAPLPIAAVKNIMKGPVR